MDKWEDTSQTTIKYIKSIVKINIKPQIAIILGSGLGALTEEIEIYNAIPYADIPYFPKSTVEGHAGNLIIGKLEGKEVIVMQGRFHYYEGYNLREVTYPLRIIKQLGVEKLIVTNAAGGINLDFHPGDLMIIKDHINMIGNNPLRGTNLHSLGSRFPDMSEAYSINLSEVAVDTAKALNIKLREGIYVAISGPSYETPAEIRFMRIIGADAVGMSTVPEVIVANHMKMKVLGISCITNMAAGVLNRKLSHQEVMDTAEEVQDKFIALIKGIVRRL